MRVYPAKATALRITHPSAGPLASGGADWPLDGFTAYCVKAGIATEDASKAFKAEPPKAKAKAD